MTDLAKVALIGSLATLFSPLASPAFGQSLRIYHIDVEQGDATLIVSPGGRTLLVDAGRNGDGDRIKNVMQQAGVTAIDYFVTTHYHANHYGAIDELASDPDVTISNSYDRGEKGDRGPAGSLPLSRAEQRSFADYQASVGRRAFALRSGDVIPLDPAVTVICITSNGFMLGSEQGTVPGSEHDAGISLLIQFGAFRYFLPGDIESPFGSRIAQANAVADVDVYRASHHGSTTGSSLPLLEALSPTAVVISNGSHSGFRHPRQAALDQLADLEPRPTIFQTNRLLNPGELGGNVPRNFIGDPNTSATTGTIVITVDSASERYVVSYRDEEHLFATKPLSAALQASRAIGNLPSETERLTALLGHVQPNVREAVAFELRRRTAFRTSVPISQPTDSQPVLQAESDSQPGRPAESDSQPGPPGEPAIMESVRDFMGWRAPSNTGEFLTETVPINLAALLSLYVAALLALWTVSPYRFVRWHELLAHLGLGKADRFSRLLAPFLVTSARCLDAVVARHSDRARRLFFDETPEVRDRRTWVPAPLDIDGQPTEALDDGGAEARSPSHPSGIRAIQRRLADERWLVVVEGPGGVGKSALAFELARRASDERSAYRLAEQRMLPVYIDVLGDVLDQEIRSRLEHLLGVAQISDTLLAGLLTRRRVLAVVDGLSEMPADALDAVKPHAGSKLTKAVVITTRVPPHLPDSVTVRPRLVTADQIDGLFEAFTDEKYGRGRFTEEQGATIVHSLRELLGAPAGSDTHGRELPMVIVELMLRQAHSRVDGDPSLQSLPRSAVDLFEQYTLDVLRRAPSLEQAVEEARAAAIVCLTPDFTPKRQPQAAFEQAQVSREALDRLVNSGLVTRLGSEADPFFKFALDPLAEYLAAKAHVMNARLSQQEHVNLLALLGNLEQLPNDARPESFIEALRECLRAEEDGDA